jgi:3-hydroxyacyl-[acyl-carrier-protein] dehydratase
LKFVLIDKLTKIEPGKLATGYKQLSLAEEYLGDHFPTFPVLPGVLMLEAMVQTAAWVVRVSQNYANSVIVLQEARNVSYGSFVSPGDRMDVTAEVIKLDDKTSTFKTHCMVDGQSTAKARLTLKHYNLTDRFPTWTDQDQKLIENLKVQFRLLSGPEALPSTQTNTASV